MLHPDYPIVTDRLQLRPLDAESDVDAVHAYQSRADVCRYIPFEPRTRDEVATSLRRQARTELTEPGQALRLAVVRRDDLTLIGDLMLFWTSAEHRSGEVGWVLHPDHQGHGYATESATALLGLAFDGGLDLHRVVARIDARNDASAALARRLGLRQEAHLLQNEWFKGEWSDELDFAMLGHEWRARHG